MRTVKEFLIVIMPVIFLGCCGLIWFKGYDAKIDPEEYVLAARKSVERQLGYKIKQIPNWGDVYRLSDFYKKYYSKRICYLLLALTILSGWFCYEVYQYEDRHDRIKSLNRKLKALQKKLVEEEKSSKELSHDLYETRHQYEKEKEDLQKEYEKREEAMLSGAFDEWDSPHRGGRS